MSTEKAITGSCLCGEVSYQIIPPFNGLQYCFCSRCQKTSGSAHGSNIILPPEQFQWISGAENVGRFEAKDAKYYATGFCKTCGSAVPWLVQTGKTMIVPAGGLNDDPDCSVERNIYWDSRAPWYQLPHKLDTYETVPGKSESCRLDQE